MSDERETLRGGFRLMSLGKTRELRLHTTVSHASAASSSPLSTYTRLTTARGTQRDFEDDAAALVQMRVQLRRKMDRNTVDENSPLRL